MRNKRSSNPFASSFGSRQLMESTCCQRKTLDRMPGMIQILMSSCSCRSRSASHMTVVSLRSPFESPLRAGFLRILLSDFLFQLAQMSVHQMSSPRSRHQTFHATQISFALDRDANRKTALITMRPSILHHITHGIDREI